MELHGAETPTTKASGDADDGVRDAKPKGVEVGPTPATSSPPRAQRVPRSAGENTERNLDCSNGRNYPKSLVNTCGRLESGSGSGDQDGGQHEDGTDIAAKKRKTRRGKPKHKKLKPYSKQLSYQQQLRSKCIGRIAKTSRQPPALYNTTQFLMADHSDLPDLEQKLSEAASLEVPALFQKPSAPSRTRDSSFSVDSDEDYFYSSPEDEEEFLTKEFSTAYEAVHEERLSTLTKMELIQEYRHLEAKMDSLTKRLRNKSIHQIEERDSENKNVSTTDSEIAKKLKLCQQRIDDLLQQNEQLRRENEMLRTEKRLHASSSESSIDSESDSDSSSNSNQSGCSCSLSSPVTSPKHTYKSRLDNIRTDNKSDSCDTSQSGSPTTSITPTNFSNGHVILNETGSLPT
ncbi:Protein HEXIM1 [Trachymyrmex septentrionalis]|uniref:Protein HEXIM1 n=1 Tax=Trachymyrmex septentrionalis TaxID=34720 RepID=A0A195EYM3_9HYME|nr:PREDICTED: protein HEXIM-like [Trachymyrmex septentrionalis]KYN33007.1 Protein HEXIM1 [Trachymyrmex septentrionalis]